MQPCGGRGTTRHTRRFLPLPFFAAESHTVWYVTEYRKRQAHRLAVRRGTRKHTGRAENQCTQCTRNHRLREQHALCNRTITRSHIRSHRLYKMICSLPCGRPQHLPQVALQ